MKDAGNVILPGILETRGGAADDLAAEKAAALRPFLVNGPAGLEVEQSHGDQALLPIPELMNASAGVGSSRFTVTDDGRLRDLPAATEADGKLLPDISIVLAC